MQNIKVAVYEDHKSLRDSLGKLIELSPGFELTGAYPNANNILNDARENRPDVILMDINMPGTNGIEALQLVKKNYPEIIRSAFPGYPEDFYGLRKRLL